MVISSAACYYTNNQSSSAYFFILHSLLLCLPCKFKAMSTRAHTLPAMRWRARVQAVNLKKERYNALLEGLFAKQNEHVSGLTDPDPSCRSYAQ